MVSKLSLSEFRERLKNNTEIGSPKLKLSPFGIANGFTGTKPFYGLFDDKSFRLTLNSAVSPSFYIIKGKYKITNNQLKVDYIMEPGNQFQLIWARYSPIILILAINIFFLFFARGLRRASTIVNLFLLFMAFYSRWNEERKRKKLEEKFISIFEIR
ncbi:hypothetical protein [Flavobacterium sp. Root420]|uniref:hypothetical protein n=1 Tax=Flavobacterium sp. Root420 TaxID=1736533 RepID=UPI0006F43D9D|nr:hypothetical protein [Flavobacterium sp. Root420]KQX15420.1 hypothetical protein ASC72_00650 [Flavobacterium sp. Root420]